MEKFVSLAESLGIVAPAPDHPATPTITPEDITDSKAFALAVLESREFRRYIIDGFALGELPAAIIIRLMDYGWGKPVERYQIEDRIPAESLTPDQLEARSARLAEMARFLRRASEFDEPLGAESVH